MRVRVELLVEIEAKDFVALANAVRSRSGSASFGGGQQGIDADRALQAFVEQLRRGLEER